MPASTSRGETVHASSMGKPVLDGVLLVTDLDRRPRLLTALRASSSASVATPCPVSAPMSRSNSSMS